MQSVTRFQLTIIADCGQQCTNCKQIRQIIFLRQPMSATASAVVIESKTSTESQNKSQYSRKLMKMCFNNELGTDGTTEYRNMLLPTYTHTHFTTRAMRTQSPPSPQLSQGNALCLVS